MIMECCEKTAVAKKAVEIVGKRLGLDVKYRCTDGGRNLMDIAVGRSGYFSDIKIRSGFETCVDIDIEISKLGEQLSVADLSDLLEKAARLSISERDRARRYVSGENITFGNYVPPEVQGSSNFEHKSKADYENYEEDRSF